MERLESLPFKGQKELFEKLERLAKVVNLNKKERDEYEESLKIYRDNRNVMDYAIEKGWTDGWTEGQAKGLEEGLAEGKAKGKVEGKLEGKLEGKVEEQRLIAANFKKRGISPDIIAGCTGLTLDEIELL